MSISNLAKNTLPALAGAAMLAFSMSPASAVTLFGPSPGAPAAWAPIQKIWWDRWGNWHWNGHRVPDPSPGYWGGRRCWAGFNGVVHCRAPDDE